MGPSRFSSSPTRQRPSAAVPAPTTLNSTSIQPASGAARMIDSGRRIGRAVSQRRCTKLPGVAWRAVTAPQCAGYAVALRSGLLQDGAFLDKDGAAVAQAFMRRPVAAAGSTFASTAMRAATPLRTLSPRIDHRLRPVGDLGGDLDAAVHRLRVHDDRVRPRQPQALRGEPQALKYAAPSGRSASPMRSFWIRSIMMTSHPASPAARSLWRVAPANSWPSGRSAAGATMRRSDTPSVRSTCQAERATREWRMSPTIATARPAKRCLLW